MTQFWAILPSIITEMPISLVPKVLNIGQDDQFYQLTGGSYEQFKYNSLL